MCIYVRLYGSGFRPYVKLQPCLLTFYFDVLSSKMNQLEPVITLPGYNKSQLLLVQNG